jgi:ABC-type sugar transport system ATPase subunit
MSVIEAQLSHPVVRCENVTKYFGAIRALNDVSLGLHGGEVTCLVGENGAGKSTLVKILTGIHQPDAGKLWIGRDLQNHLTPQRAREAGVEAVFQDLALCNNLDAVENIVLGQEPLRFRLGPLRLIDRRESLAIATQITADIGVKLDNLTTAVRRLSGGQRQAVAIARAMVRGHKLLIFDEPTAALSLRQKLLTLDLVRRVAEQKVAVLMITHNLDDIFAVGDRVIVVRLGRVNMDERVADVTHQDVISHMVGSPARPPK